MTITDQRLSNQDLFVALKTVLKQKGLTYKDLAKQLNVSLSTVKGIFSHSNTTINRVLRICELIDFPFGELVNLAGRSKEDVFELTYAQEFFFAQNPHFYFFFREHFFQKKSLKDIQKLFMLTDKSITLYLLGLEKIGLLELHMNNKVQYKVSGKQKWASQGPWYKKFLGTYIEHLLSFISKEERNGYTSNIGFSTLSQDNFERFIFEIKNIEKKYRDIAYQDYLMDKHHDGIHVSWNFNIASIDVYELETQIINL